MLRRLTKAIVPSWLISFKLPKNQHNGILLTFDDGPHEVLTPKILDILKAHNIKAVFFLLGKQIKQHPEIVKQIQSEGHLIGNHSTIHISAKNSNFAEYLKEIQDCQKLIEEIIGIKPLLFRPPFGDITLTALAAIKRMEMKVVLWSIETGEWGVFAHETAAQMSDRLLNTIKSQDIILMHDNSEKVPEILLKSITQIQAKGLHFIDPATLYKSST